MWQEDEKDEQEEEEEEEETTTTTTTTTTTKTTLFPKVSYSLNLPISQKLSNAHNGKKKKTTK